MNDQAAAEVQLAGQKFAVDPDSPFLFGRADQERVVGLDPRDMGISAVAGSVEANWGLWWVVNQSTKRPLLLEIPDGSQLRLSPGHRHAVMGSHLKILVPGAIYTHVLEVFLPEEYARRFQAEGQRSTTGTVTGAVVALSERERDALAALCSGYLESFPYRSEHPNTYEECGRLLGGAPWTADRVRKAVERVKTRFAGKQGIYFEGPHANYELAGYLISAGVLSGQDLARLAGRRQV